MPSPFPGTDPYLEGSVWMSVHTELSVEIARVLAPKLRPNYLAFTARTMVMEIPDGVAITTASMYPDAGIIARGASRISDGAAAVAPPLQLATVVPTPIPHVTVEIRDTANRQLVTAIEVLSPT